MEEDYCSFWPDGKYGSCCKQHDIDYTAGGNWRDRRAADKKLRDCIAKKQGRLMAWTMWIGVRCVGWMPHHFKRKKLNWNLKEEDPKP